MKTKIKYDYWLLACVIILPFMGAFYIHAAQPEGTDYALSQIKWFFVGIIAMIIIARVDIEQWYKHLKLLYWLCVVALASLFILPESLAPVVNGAQRWLAIPGLGQIQVAEFTRIIFIIVVARIITYKTESLYEMDFGHIVELLFEIGKWLILPCILIFGQPNTSGIMIMGVGIICMLIVSKVPLKYVYWLLAIIALVAFALVIGIIYFPEQMKIILGDYRVERMQGWLMPFQYTDYSYQLRSAIVNFGSGGMTGLGHNNAMIEVSEGHTDFILSTVGAEGGFIGFATLMFLEFFMLFRMSEIARKTKDETKRYIVIGFMGMFAMQIFWNAGMCIGLVPISGLPMPFISYGGSSMLSLFIMIGFIMNINSSSTFKN